MKKTLFAFCILLGASTVHADVITNYVYIVSNIFNNVYSESVVTQKIKSTHTDYFFTNYVSVVTNIYETTFHTNIDVTVIFDNFEPWVIAASNAAERASGYSDEAAASSVYGRTICFVGSGVCAVGGVVCRVCVQCGG